MIDTHCHLNFKAFNNQANEIILRAKEVGVDHFVVPGTDIETSKKAVELAEKQQEIYAAVGIHPHHIYQYQKLNIKDQNYILNIKKDLQRIEDLLKYEKVVAVGEVGIDKYFYRDTKYSKYVINPDFVELQKTAFIEQIKLAIKYKKSLIIHNREAVGETLQIMGDSSILNPLAGHIVLHCCEANQDLLDFALAHQIYIGVDGDVTYRKSKQEFIKRVPLELLVLETDSPFLLPEPLRSEKKYPNEPKNTLLIAGKIAEIKNTTVQYVGNITTNNAKKLFSLSY